MRYRQHKKDGTVIQAEWLTNFSIAKLPTVSFFKRAKSRWEIENHGARVESALGFNDAKNLYGMAHIQHHHPNSMLVNWLFLLVALMIERLYRLRYLHRGTHPIITAMKLKDTLGYTSGPLAPTVVNQGAARGPPLIFDNLNLTARRNRAAPSSLFSDGGAIRAGWSGS